MILNTSLIIKLPTYSLTTGFQVPYGLAGGAGPNGTAALAGGGLSRSTANSRMLSRAMWAFTSIMASFCFCFLENISDLFQRYRLHYTHPQILLHYIYTDTDYITDTDLLDAVLHAVPPAWVTIFLRNSGYKLTTNGENPFNKVPASLLKKNYSLMRRKLGRNIFLH